MSDLIERQAAIDVVSEWLWNVLRIKESDGQPSVFKRLRSLPSAQPEPKRGKWVFKNDLFTVPTGYWECSECKEGRLLYEENFCPHCGADMRTARQIVHDAIDNTPMAEDAFPGIKERLHKAVDEMREVAE